jgi:mannose-6-phosphate isomerase-like protein (cupin superfamily)
MDLHHLADVLAEQSAGGRAYLEFLRSDSLSVGLYVLRVGDVDRQQPHREDEIYVVMSGRSRFTAGEDTRQVTAGDTIFVAAGVPHRFHDVTEELHLVVVFAPPETSPLDTSAG